MNPVGNTSWPSIQIKRRPLVGNEPLFQRYWDEHLNEWPMHSESRLSFMRSALQDIWLYFAYVEDHMLGMLVNEEGDHNALLLLHVLPGCRNRGIGRALVGQAGSHVDGTWTLGQGRGYWWQGVPEGSGEAFFVEQGFRKTWTSIDMLLDLQSWNSSSFEANHPVRPVGTADAAALLHMLEQEVDLSGWAPHYQDMLCRGNMDRIFVATRGEEIIGCAMLLESRDIRWNERYVGRTSGTGAMGGIGCLGVRSTCRETGVGSSLVVALTGELKAQGYAGSLLGYTWLEDWYGKFGYRTCCRYMMGAKEAPL